MQVRDIMTLEVRTIPSSATVLEAAKKMDDENVGALPVIDGEHVVGIVTDRDIVIRSTAADQQPSKMRVTEVMSAPAICGHADQTIEEAAAVLKENYIRRLPVLDESEQLVGMATADDLMVEIPERESTAADVFRTLAEVERPGM